MNENGHDYDYLIKFLALGESLFTAKIVLLTDDVFQSLAIANCVPST